jgi:hypothetical protein
MEKGRKSNLVVGIGRSSPAKPEARRLDKSKLG